MDLILTKQEYEAQETDLVKRTIALAMSTDQFNNTGCYRKEFVKVGGKEVTLLVMDDNWIALTKADFYDIVL